MLSLCLLIKLKKEKKRKRGNEKENRAAWLLSFEKCGAKIKFASKSSCFTVFLSRDFSPLLHLFDIQLFTLLPIESLYNWSQQFLALPSIQTFLVRCRSGNCLINLRIGQQPPPCHPFWRVLISPRSGTRYRAPLIFFNGVDNLIAVITLERSPRVNPVFRSPFSFVTGLVTSPPLLSLFVNEVNERAVPEKGWEQRRVFIWQFNSKNKRCVTL